MTGVDAPAGAACEGRHTADVAALLASRLGKAAAELVPCEPLVRHLAAQVEGCRACIEATRAAAVEDVAAVMRLFDAVERATEIVTGPGVVMAPSSYDGWAAVVTRHHRPVLVVKYAGHSGGVTAMTAACAAMTLPERATVVEYVVRGLSLLGSDLARRPSRLLDPATDTECWDHEAPDGLQPPGTTERRSSGRRSPGRWGR